MLRYKYLVYYLWLDQFDMRTCAIMKSKKYIECWIFSMKAISCNMTFSAVLKVVLTHGISLMTPVSPLSSNSQTTKSKKGDKSREKGSKTLLRKKCEKVELEASALLLYVLLRIRNANSPHFFLLELHIHSFMSKMSLETFSDMMS